MARGLLGQGSQKGILASARVLEIENELKEQFRNGNYIKGILHIIEEMGEILALHFPRKEDDVNELSDEVNVN